MLFASHAEEIRKLNILFDLLYVYYSYTAGPTSSNEDLTLLTIIENHGNARCEAGHSSREATSAEAHIPATPQLHCLGSTLPLGVNGGCLP